MPKVKIPRKGTPIDMTAMCDVAFLLLTFFILTTQFKADEAVIVDTPSATSNIQITENRGIGTITVSRDGKIFFGFDMQPIKESMLLKMAEKYGIPVTENEVKMFSVLPSFGVPINQLKSYLALPADQRKKIEQPGIPADSANNELTNWILYAYQSFSELKQSKPELFELPPKPGSNRPQQVVFRIVVKGDGNAKYESVKKVISTLQDRNLTRISFITDLEGPVNKEQASIE